MTPTTQISTAIPPSKPPRTKRAARKKVGSFRGNDAEMARCKAKAKKQGKTLSAYALMSMLNRRDRRPCIPAINKEAHDLLGKATGSLNQIALVFNRTAKEARLPVPELLTELLGGELAKAWLDELSGIREEVKRLRLTLLGVGLEERDVTFSDENESRESDEDTTAEREPELVS